MRWFVTLKKFFCVCVRVLYEFKGMFLFCLFCALMHWSPPCHTFHHLTILASITNTSIVHSKPFFLFFSLLSLCDSLFLFVPPIPLAWPLRASPSWAPPPPPGACGNRFCLKRSSTCSNCLAGPWQSCHVGGCASPSARQCTQYSTSVARPSPTSA